MIEAVPRDPYGGYISDLLLVEKNMQLRRKRLHAVLRNNEIAPTSANFPMLGVDGYEHAKDINGAVAASQYVSDRVINPHPRFGTLTKNIRQRRQENVNILIPRGVDNIGRIEVESSDVGSDKRSDCCEDEMGISEVFRRGQQSRGLNMNIDIETAQQEQMEVNGKEGKVAVDDTIHMDAMAFGMGCCCLQVTMQANDDRESRFLHDQLALLGPLFLALSASTPIFKGIVPYSSFIIVLYFTAVCCIAL